jgi:F-type H+-transporting ATPase subunit b
MNIEIKQVITQILAFLVMLWILKKYSWKPLLSLLDERTNKIKAAFREAEEKNLQAEKYKAEYEQKIAALKNEGQVIIQNAVKEARQIAAEIQNESHKKANEILNKAKEQSDRELEKARVELKKEMIEISCLAFEKLVHQKLSQEDRDRFGLELMKEVL